MKTQNIFKLLLILFLAGYNLNSQAETKDTATSERSAKHILFIGDSMTGWLSERLNAYGKENGFDVSTVVWDGSTMLKWGNSQKLKSIVAEYNPDAVFISLGMNELFEMHPGTRLKPSLDNILNSIGSRPVLWVGPPSWPGFDKGKVLNDWLEEQLGSNRFYRSSNLKLPRQSTKNPHPTKQGMMQWMDEIMKWIPENALVQLPGTDEPQSVQMSRGTHFIYKRMTEKL